MFLTLSNVTRSDASKRFNLAMSSTIFSRRGSAALLVEGMGLCSLDLEELAANVRLNPFLRPEPVRVDRNEPVLESVDQALSLSISLRKKERNERTDSGSHFCFSK